ncbi:adenosylhomocysteinase [Salinibacterium sp. NK8237]|uniref:adenosylhomocysteinase n=1 Tax=Salinibacterium sp. NK8237 TaxID=2792038 RepID=UPI0018CE774C|nr:adenosylhomocysteinase [Salinibacterium sp. NK8237]MBH0130986.1 adenosylhomocysteinase [Salinibacterium sp. NK8237]
MADVTLIAERIIRRFARDTNLLVAGRSVRISAAQPETAQLIATSRELARMLRALGAHVVTASRRDATATAHLLDIQLGAAGPDSEITATFLLGGAPLPSRGDADGRIDFAGEHMPVSRMVAKGLGERGSVKGLRIGIAMVLEPKTAQLALLLAAAGADVAVYAHPDEIDASVAEALRARGIAVDGSEMLSGQAERAAALAFLERGFDILLDDGSHLIRLAHEDAPHLVKQWIGANEETTSGLTPLRQMSAQGILDTAVFAVNDAQMKTRFDNRYGTGQSCVFAIADALDRVGVSVRDQPALVIGYGPVGEGVAAHLAALGAEVRVAEVDPVLALRAAHDGYEIGEASALGAGALLVSSTGVAHTIGAELARTARAVAVAGGVPGELDLDGLLSGPPAEQLTALADHVDRADPAGTLVLDRGGCINITAAEGNPIEIMDLSFAVQLAAVEELVVTRPGIGVHVLPASIDDTVARAALAARGEHIDTPADAQVAAAHDWRSRRYLTSSPNQETR